LPETALSNSPGTGSCSRSVLIVEDNDAVRQFFVNPLTREGYQVFPAHSCGEAQDYARRHGIDLLVTDLNLPDGDGRELARQLRQQIPGLKVLICSGSFETSEGWLASEMGADALIVKPFARRVVLETVRNLFA